MLSTSLDVIGNTGSGIEDKGIEDQGTGIEDKDIDLLFSSESDREPASADFLASHFSLLWLSGNEISPPRGASGLCGLIFLLMVTRGGTICGEMDLGEVV